MKNKQTQPIMSVNKFQQRIAFKGELRKLIDQVIDEYNFSEYKKHEIIEVGYEDFNIKLETQDSIYLLKFLAKSKSKKNCKRYIKNISTALNHDVKHPKIIKNERHQLLTSIHIENTTLELIIIQFIEGQTFFENGMKPNQNELKILASEAAKINSINYKPYHIYDHWAVVNFLKEYQKIFDNMKKSDIGLIEPLKEKFKKIEIKDLPHSFVHGDIIDTNIIKSKDNTLYILDFSVSNYYPRIQELAVLLCDPAFDINHPNKFEQNLEIILSEYQKTIRLTKKEKQALPFFIQAAHAMHIIGATRCIINDDDSDENQHWLNSGRNGLRFTQNYFLKPDKKLAIC